MGDPENKLQKFQVLYETGKLDEMLKDGAIDQAKYNAVVAKVRPMGTRARAQELGVPNPADEPPTVPGPPQPMTAGAAAAAYTTPVELARASAYVPGHGPAPTSDGSWWDNVKNAIPQVARDATLLPSRGPVYTEPSDAEAEAAVKAEFEAQGLREKTTYSHLQLWKDKQWAKAYDDAKNRGEAIYRGKDIDENSPVFMQVAKRAAEITGPLESGLRQIDRMAAFGTVFNMIDVPPPSGESPEVYQETVARNLERGARVASQHPYAGAVGAATGVMTPAGAGNAMAGLAGWGVGKVLSGRGAISGMAKSGAEALLGATAEQGLVGALDSSARQIAGLPPIPIAEQAEEALTTGAISGLAGTVLGFPLGVSRGLREGSGKVQSSHRTLESGGRYSTKFWSQHGLNEPTGHEEMSAKYGIEGAEAGARSEAANKAANVLEAEGLHANITADITAERMASELEVEGIEAMSAVGGLAEKIVAKGERSGRLVEEQSMRFVKRLMDKVQEKRVADKARMAGETEAAMSYEGAPAYPETPGPGMHIDELASMQAEANANDYGLSTEYPSVSVDRIIDKAYEINQKMAFLDGENMPSTSATKFKRASEGLFRKKIVEPEELHLYEDVAYSMRELPDGSAEVLLPRLVSARELDDLIQTYDEMAKYPGGADPDAARYRELGAVARELREEGFKVLADTKARQHVDLNENEAMLRAIGLPANIDEVNPANVDQAVAVLSKVKEMAGAYDLRTPEGLAIPKRQFEQWLSKYDKDLFDEYMLLRDLATQGRAVASFNITVGATPRARSESYKMVEDAITGKRRDNDALLNTFRSVADQVATVRAQSQKTTDIFTMLGADGSMGSMTPNDRSKMRVKLNQILLKGGEEFASLRKAAKPEQQKMLDISRQAAADTDSMFRALGFGPDHKRPGFTSATRENIVDGLDEAFKKYKTFGKGVDFSRSVDEIFKKRPEVKTALLRMAEERAFHFLRNEARSGAKDAFGVAKPKTYGTAVSDFFENHIDAMVSRNKGLRSKLNPFSAPVPYAMSLSAPVVSEETQKHEAGLEHIPPALALEALIEMVGKLESEKKK